MTVWSVWWGRKYPPAYVHNLKHAVERRLVMPHRFRCLTTNDLRGIERVDPGCEYPGWWQKLALFKPGIADDGLNLYIDLDSVIVGGLDRLVIRYREASIAIPANWAQSGHGGCQSSLMLWQGGAHPEIWQDFDDARDRPRLWGDQEWITERLGSPGAGRVTAIEHPLVCSYKYHCRDQGRPPEGAAVVTFHGEPKPSEAEETWVKTNWW